MIDYIGKLEYYPALFAMSKAALFGEKPDYEALSRLDSGQLFRLAGLHAVIPEFADVIPEMDMDAESAERWETRILTELRRYLEIVTEEAHVTELLRKEGIPSVILKGSAAACYYPKAELRQHGDIDLFVPTEQFDQSYDLLIADGFTDDIDITPRHKHLSKDRIKLELHRQFSEENVAKERKDFIEALIQNGIRKAVPFTVEGKTVYRLPDPENGLVLLQHLCQHFKTGVGLRHLTDWMTFVDKVVDNAFWEKEFKPLTEKAGLTEFASIMTAICIRDLGLPREGHEWYGEPDESLVDEAFLHILLSGNMGRGQEFVQKKMVVGLQDKRNIFTRFQTSGLNNWKAAQKHKILRPFAWLYQCFHVLNTLLFKHKNSLKSMREGIKEGKRQQELFDRLGI